MKIFLSILLLVCSSLLTAQDSSVIGFIPKKQFIPSFTASGTEHRLSYAKHLSSGAFFAGLGGSFPAAIVRYRGIECLITVSGTVYTTLANAGIKYQVTNADYYADVTFDIPVAHETVLRLGSGHTSHHLVDDAVITLGNSNVLNYARDYYQFFLVQNIPLLRGFVYGGTYYNHSFLVNVRRDGQFLFQLGADGGNIHLFHTFELYTAFDIKIRSEVNYGSTQSYQLGVRTRNELFRAARIAYTYRTGMEERGQFYNQRTITHSIGLYFDF